MTQCFYKLRVTILLNRGPAPGLRDWGGGAETNFLGAREVYLCEIESVDQTKKVFCTKISTNSGCCHKILSIFIEFFSEDKKKRTSSQKFCENR